MSNNNRAFDQRAFDQAYDQVILGNNFFEYPEYYQQNRPRYLETFRRIAALDLPSPARLLEIGGGQMALLSRQLFKDHCTLADVNASHASAVTQFGIEFMTCDLMHDDIKATESYDIIVLLEVIEHLPVPPHTVFEKLAAHIKPGGYLFLTTPNLYRLRNSIRLFLGMPVFYNFFFPKRGESLGHPIEYSAEHMRFQLERANLNVEYVDQVQLMNEGAHLHTKIARRLLKPLQMRPLWRDSLIACAQKPY